MKKKASSLFAVPILVLLATSVPVLLLMLPARLPPAFAHTEIQQGDVKIEAGWGTEPPLQGQPNTIVISVTRGNEPVTNALEGANIAIKKGGDSKALDFRP